MPEGPEVKNLVDELNAYVQNLHFVGIELLTKPADGKLYKMVDDARKALFANGEAYKLSAHCKGKFMYFELSNISKNAEKTKYVASHMMLKGNYSIKPHGNSIFRMIFVRSVNNVNNVNTVNNVNNVNTVNNVNNEPCSLYYEDPTYFSKWCVISKTELDEELADLGPDIMDNSAANVDKFIAIVDKLRVGRRNMQLCQLMMNQKIVCGIGNYLKSEILYDMINQHTLFNKNNDKNQPEISLKPDVSFRDVSNDTYRKLFASAHKIAVASYQLKGHSTYTNINGLPGSYNPDIYGRDVAANGKPVTVVTCADGRKTYIIK